MILLWLAVPPQPGGDLQIVVVIVAGEGLAVARTGTGLRPRLGEPNILFLHHDLVMVFLGFLHTLFPAAQDIGALAKEGGLRIGLSLAAHGGLAGILLLGSCLLYTSRCV